MGKFMEMRGRNNNITVITHLSHFSMQNVYSTVQHSYLILTPRCVEFALMFTYFP